MDLVNSHYWIRLSIGDIAEVVAGGTPKAGDPENFKEPGTGVPWLTPADLSGYSEMYIGLGSRDLSQKGYDSSSAKLLPKGSLLFSSRAPIGYVAIAKNDISTNQGFKNFVFPYGVNSRYAYYYLRSIRNVAERMGTGTTFKEMSGSTAKTLPFLLPPLEEQAVIAEKLNNLLAQVETTKASLERIPEILKTFRQSVLAAAVSGKLTEEWRTINNFESVAVKHNSKLPKLYEDEYYIEAVEGWVWLRLGSVVSLINGDRGKNYPNKSEYVKQGIPFINTGHIDPDGTLSDERMNFISPEKYDSLGGGKTESTDLVYCLRGATIGKTARVHYEFGAIASSLVIVRPTDNIQRDFAYYFLISPLAKKLISDFDNGSAQPNLSAKSLATYPLQLPPIEEQTEIVRRVKELFTLADRIEGTVNAALERVNNLTQSILAKAFRSELTADWRAANPDLITGENSAESLLKKIKAEQQKLLANKPRRRKQCDG
ncbi:restriction endonuclease subunit S [Idiomarina sp. 29L]|uniref:restriction endonuclease subunit S n=1 Tax=Idiomarina sp. 29L TaxID=2508877 RepID=UPI0010117133|nr:restriction endonuclease subunit S [Idiomarina sp. 29L]RXS41521.1 restriction endonuclease subunit S [Idiomarina sp. 29L]